MASKDNKLDNPSNELSDLEAITAESSEQLAPRSPSRQAIILALIAVGMAFFFVPLYVISATAHDNAVRLDSDLVSIRTSLTLVPTPLPEVKSLLANLAQVQAQVDQVNLVYPTLVAGRKDWSAIMSSINSYNPKELTLTSVTRTENRFTINGRATRDDAVVAYAHALEQSNLYSQVAIQSIQISPTPIVTPTATATATMMPTLTSTSTQTPTGTPPPTLTPVPATPVPSATNTPLPTATNTATLTVTTTPTATTTPDLRDAYEPDDSYPKPIAFGQTQRHSFYPDGDVDRVSFLAKSGRFYRVYTTELSPGVDTFLTVDVGSTPYSNDDVKPGTLASEIIFQNTGSDISAVVTITNRGQYGSNMWYKIVVEEIIPTPTASRTATSTATTTLTPTPTPTSTWTSSPTNSPTLQATATRTPTPTATIAAGSAKIRGMAMPLRPDARSTLESRAPLASDSMLVKFAIILELKAAAP